MADGKFILKIYRGVPDRQYFEEFELDRGPGKNIVSALLEIQKYPITRQGKKVEPVVWDMACLEEVCGSCSMLVNSIPRQACTALIEDVIKKSRSSKIILAPFSKFPLIRDLIIDRTVMFDNLIKTKAWVPVDQYHTEEFGDKISPVEQEAMYKESTCMTCGCCLEACPQVNKRSHFVGPAVINQAKLFNAQPSGKSLKSARLSALMGKGGVNECGNAQNCVAVCPKNIELTQSIAKIGRDVTKEFIKQTTGLPECSE